MTTITPALSYSLDIAYQAGEVGIDTFILTACHCGGRMEQHGVVATGQPVMVDPERFPGEVLYVPKRGEVLKNHHCRCLDCGFEQWS